MNDPNRTPTWQGTAIADLLGWKQTEERPGFVRSEFTATEDFLNPRGAIMGGYVAAMMDMILSAAVRSSLRPDQQPRATLEMKVNFLRAAQPGTLLAEGKVVHGGRSVAFAEATLSTPDGELLATASSTMRIYTP